MWLDLQKPATYAHNGIERYSSPMDSSINKLNNYCNTIAKSWLICLFWGLFLRPVRHPLVLRCLLNATSWLLQASTLLKIITWFVHDVGHGFIYSLWHSECNGTFYTLKITELCSNLPLCGYSPPLHKCSWYR